MEASLNRIHVLGPAFLPSTTRQGADKDGPIPFRDQRLELSVTLERR
jgi:hypothetical protein